MKNSRIIQEITEIIINDISRAKSRANAFKQEGNTPHASFNEGMVKGLTNILFDLKELTK